MKTTVKTYPVALGSAELSSLPAFAARRFQPENWEDVQEGRERVELDADGRNLCSYLTKPDSECWFVVYRFRSWVGVAGDCYASRGEALARADSLPATHRALAIVGTLPTHANYMGDRCVLHTPA